VPGERRGFDFAFLDEEERIGGVALSENGLALVPVRDASARADSGEKRLGIEGRFGDVRHKIRQAGLARLVTAPFPVSYFITISELFCTDFFRNAPYFAIRSGDAPPRGLKCTSGEPRFVQASPRGAAPGSKFPPREPGVAKFNSRRRHGSFSKSAIDTHARVLKYWYGDKAPQEARGRALECGTVGDFEGLQAWARVARLCEALGAAGQSTLK